MSKINSKIAIAISVLLIASMLLIALPKVNSQVVERQITLLIAAAPETVGVGQSLQILCWADIYPNTYIPQNNSLYVEGSSGEIYARYHDYKFTITHPDGTTETKTFDQTDPLGSAYFTYTPSDIGTYTVSCYYPGESFEDSPTHQADASFAPAQSKTVSFVVQEESVPYTPETPLPTSYWSRPITGSNYLWKDVASNWPGRFRMWGAGKEYWTNFQPYGTAPNTAHILWANIWQAGGIVEGDLENTGYYTGESYQIKFAPIILNGRLYANMRIGNAALKGFKCFDLRTGEELYTNNDINLDFAFSYSYQSENQHGTIDFLISFAGSTMRLIDPLRGEVIFNIENATSAAAFIADNTGPNSFGTNDLNAYYRSGPSGARRLIKWSFFECTKPLSGFQWNPSNAGPYNWADGIVYNVSMPSPANSGDYNIGNFGPSKIDGTTIVLRSSNTTLWPPTTYLIGMNCDNGQVLWETTNQLIADPGIWQGGGGLHLSSDGGVYLQYKKETMQTIAFNLANGQVKYTTEPRGGSDWGSYTSGWPMDSAYGMFYQGAYDGYIIAYDLETGAEQWRYYAGDAGFETPYGTYPFFMGIPYGMAIADGKIFAATNEHSPNDPLYRGYRLHVVDAETGEGVWNISGWWLGNGIADGEYVGYNGYDGKVYAFGMGPSATSVSVGPKSSTMGNKVIIEGMVTDISAGTEDFTISANYPQGIPVIADEYMTPWMEHLYMQQPLPTNAMGVEVWIDVIDANGNYRNIGTATSDISGYYSFEWEPDIPGKYTVIATFAGTESYYASYSESSFTVAEPTVTPAPTPEPASMTDTYVLGIGAAAIVAIIVIGLIIILMLRKR